MEYNNNQQVNYWFHSRNFFNFVRTSLSGPESEISGSDFDSELHKFRSRFINLLKNNPKNLADRQKLQSAAKNQEPVSLSPSSAAIPRRHGIQVEERLVNEALILSDLFDVNELKAVELILAGQQETANYPGFTRGLCAVMCYYNSHNFLVQSLKCLLMARNGRSWQYDTLTPLRGVLTKFTDKLWHDGQLMQVLMDAVRDFDLSMELDKLQQPNVKGLGDCRHRKLVSELILTIHETISECILIWSCLNPLSPLELDSLAKFVRNMDLKYGFRKIEGNMLCSALYAIDASLLECIDDTKELELVPFAAKESSLNSYQKSLCDGSYKNAGIQSVMFWAWSVSLRMVTQHHLAEKTLENFDQDEEELMDQALDSQPFNFLRRSILSVDNFDKESLWVQRLHSLVTQTIFYFKMKVKEMRSIADEEIRTAEDAAERGQPPKQVLMNFMHLLLLIGDLYEKDSAGLNLCEQYWCHPTAVNDDSMIRNRYTPLQTTLFKFLHSSGELLPAVLYVAYLKMITSLVGSPNCAHQALQLLKANASYNGSQLSSVSLSHFFQALQNYWSTMKEHTGMMKPVQISPEECQGLIAWSSLLARIASNDEKCCLELVEMGQWQCLKSCFGLLTCAVPLILKQGIWRLLAAVAKSEALNGTLWDALFQTGILVPSHGMVQELEEIESRNEEYPNLVGFLEFLSELTAQGIPDAQMTGFYVEFLLHCVVTKFQYRAYKNSADLWKVGRFAMEILWKLVMGLDVSVESVRNSTAGCTVMTQMMNDGPVFRAVVTVLDDGITLMDQYSEFSGKLEMQSATLYALKLTEAVLVRQNLFSDCVRDAGVAILTSRLDLLLQTLNPKNMEANYVTRIACYLQYNNELPNHCLATVSIMQCLAATTAAVQTKLVQYFTRKKDISGRILAGFVDCLILDEMDSGIDLIDSDPESASESEIHGKTALTILETIDRSLSLAAGSPNLAYFLLGFDSKRPHSTNLENPGVNGVQRNCLHAIVEILNSCKDKYMRQSAIGILCSLAWNGSIAEPTLRYLRTAHDLISQLSIQLKPKGMMESTESMHYAGSLMKMAAMEFFILSAANQRSQVLRLAKIWMEELSQSQFNANTSTGESTMLDYSRTLMGSTLHDASKLSARNADKKAEIYLPKLMGILKELEFSVPHLEDPFLQFFDSDKISKVIAACSSTIAPGPVQCDVSKLHALLMREVIALQGTSVVGHQQLIKQEVEALLDHVVTFNQIQREAWAKINAFQGWSHMVDVLFTRIPIDYLPVEKFIELGGEMLACLLEKAVSSEVLPDIGIAIGKCCVHLTSWMRRLFLSENTAILDASVIGDDETASNRSLTASVASSHYIRVLDKTGASSRRVKESEEWKHLVPILPAFRLLIEFVLKPGDQRIPATRTHLYGSLMNLLYLTKASRGKTTASDKENESPSFIALDGLSMKDRMSDDQWNILSRYQTELAELVAKDACDGSDVCKAVALSLLSVVLLQDSLRNGQLIGFLGNRGYVRHLVDSVGVDDIRLMEIAKNTSLPLRPLYIFQAKLALFTRAGMTDMGKSILCQHGLIPTLINCACWNIVSEEVVVQLKHKEEIPMKTDPRTEFEENLLLCWKKLKIIESKVAEKRLS